MKRNDSPRRHPAAATAATAGLALALLVSGCGSTPAPTHFHTLMPPASASSERSHAGEAIDWQLMPVRLPAQVDRPQWVLRTADGSLVVLEQERWIAPLADEIHAAVIERLTQTLGPPGAVEPAKPWLVRIDIRRFDLVAGGQATLTADWSAARDRTAINCHATVVSQATSSGYTALASAQRKGVSELADAIGAVLKRSDKGQALACS
jgi:uncharacterized lipoprotein YmbA